MKQLPIVILAMILGLLTSQPLRAEYILLADTDPAKPFDPQGNVSLLDHRFSPGSTMKIVIAWAALEENLVTLEIDMSVTDIPIIKEQKLPPLQAAMQYSSNQYFAALARKLGREKLRHYVQASGFFASPLPAGWPNKLEESVHGAGLTTTPKHMMLFARKLTAGLSDRPAINQTLTQALHSPFLPKGSVYSKSGTYGGAAWQVGWYQVDERRIPFVILVPYQPPNWKPAKAEALRLLEKSAGPK